MDDQELFRKLEEEFAGADLPALPDGNCKHFEPQAIDVSAFLAEAARLLSFSVVETIQSHDYVKGLLSAEVERSVLDDEGGTTLRAIHTGDPDRAHALMEPRFRNAIGSALILAGEVLRGNIDPGTLPKVEDGLRMLKRLLDVALEEEMRDDDDPES